MSSSYYCCKLLNCFVCAINLIVLDLFPPVWIANGSSSVFKPSVVHLTVLNPVLNLESVLVIIDFPFCLTVDK